VDLDNFHQVAEKQAIAWLKHRSDHPLLRMGGFLLFFLDTISVVWKNFLFLVILFTMTM